MNQDWKQFKEWQSKNESQEIKEEVKHHQLSKPTVGNNHKWIQRGTYICCDSCESQHGFSVKPGTIMIGIENGMPVFK